MFGVPAIKSGYVSPVKNALRFRAANSAYGTWTPSGAGNRKTWTAHYLLKRGSLGSQQYLLSANRAGGANYSGVFFRSTDELGWADGDIGTAYTAAVFRDPGAWLPITIQFDSTEATAANRVKFYIEDAELSKNGASLYPALNTDYAINGTEAHSLGRFQYLTNGYFDGVIARFVLVDGSILAPSTFGQRDAATGQWVPKALSGITYGTNGRLYEFKDTTSTTTLGYDTSGNGNNATLTNFSVTAGVTYDPSTDVPTNNYATWNPLFGAASYPATFSRANTRAATSGSAQGRAAVSTQTVLTGKRYAEFTFTTAPTGILARVGVIGDNDITRSIYFSAGEWSPAQSGTNTVLYFGNGTRRVNATDTALWGSTFTTGDVIGVAFDADTGKVWFAKNGTWQASGDPAAGTNPATTLTTGMPFYFAAQLFETTDLDANFGQRAFAYTAPTGFSAMNTGNLSTPSTKKSSNAFAAVLDTEANIEATLAAARSGWTDYVEILKNRDASETWAWRFSHDASNEHACSTTDTYQTRASRTMSGSNKWVGYGIRIGSTYGTAAGSASHTNGAATTITHNLGRSRNVVILFPRAGGEVYLYHPDLTAGSLVMLTDTAAQAASTVITSVGSNSFQIGSGVATGTYDYLVLGEMDGGIELSAAYGNGSADGPFSFKSVRSALTLIFNAAGGSNWRAWDDVRSTANVAGLALYPSLSNAEATENFIDMLSNGTKIRDAGTMSVSGNLYIHIDFPRNPFKYANAR